MIKGLLKRIFGRRAASPTPIKEQCLAPASNPNPQSKLSPESNLNPGSNCSAEGEPSNRPENSHINRNEISLQSGATAEKKEPPRLTYQDRLDQKRKERGLPPVPRVPDRSDELEQGDVVLYSSVTRFVVRRPNNTVVKHGDYLNLSEVDAIQFAKEAGIPVPDVLSSGKQECGNKYTYIEMKNIEGETLAAVWEDLTRETRLDIAHQLRDILRTMRSLSPPVGFIGGFNSDKLRDYRGTDVFIRPACQNERDFNMFLSAEEDVPIPVQRAFRQSIGDDHRIVFSHCDIAPRNIMVRENRIVALIDWEAAGWYPEYWEYVKFMHNAGRERGWKELVDEVFPETYQNELLLYTGLHWFQSKWDGEIVVRPAVKKKQGASSLPSDTKNSNTAKQQG